MPPHGPSFPDAVEAENIGTDAAAPADSTATEQKEYKHRIHLDPADFPPGTIIDPDESLPPVWRVRHRDGPVNELYIYGPKGAKFDEPPPQNVDPPEPAEEVGETLTPRQLAFCDHYVERPVAAIAARAAGYAEATAAKQASRLLKHPLIIRRILELRRKRRLDEACRRETLVDKLEVVFAQAVERNELYAAIQTLTMQARLVRIQEAMPGFRYFARFENGREQLLWDALTRLEQKLSEIAVGDFPGAAAAVPKTPFLEGDAAEAARASPMGFGAEERAAYAMDRAGPRRK